MKKKTKKATRLATPSTATAAGVTRRDFMLHTIATCTVIWFSSRRPPPPRQQDLRIQSGTRHEIRGGKGVDHRVDAGSAHFVFTTSEPRVTVVRAKPPPIALA